MELPVFFNTCSRWDWENVFNIIDFGNDSITKDIALALASSCIAATLLEGGRTAHSTLKLPLKMQINETPTCNLSRNSAMTKVLQQSKFIVWDECK